ncbi:MAG: helix-turn-helix transcriptional regulator [Acidobacteriota bacterium]
MITVSYEAQRADQQVELLYLEEVLKRDLEPPPTQAHRPSFYLMVLYTAGSGEHLVDDRRHPCRRGSLIFVAPGQAQALPTDPTIRGRMLLFTPQAVEAARLLSGPLESSGVLDHRLHPPLTSLEEPEVARLERLTDLIAEESAAVEEGIRQDVLLHLFTVWILLSQRYRQARGQQQSGLPYLEFRRFLKLLDQRRRESRNASDYAHWLGISPRQLRRITSRVAGLSPKDLIDREIVLEIKRWLLQPGVPLKRIASELGFEGPEALVKYFRRCTGETPGAWRQSQESES